VVLVSIHGPPKHLHPFGISAGFGLLIALALALVSAFLVGGARSATPAPGLIAFARPDGIYVMREDGTGVRPLRRGYAASKALQLDWSPDGSRLAFESRGAIWVMGADGKGLTRLVARGNHWGSAHSPSWSPDGRKLAFSGAASQGIWVVGADGSNVHRLLRVTKLGADMGFSDVGVGEIDWSPDGRRIAFTAHAGYVAWVYVVDRNGANLRRLTNSGWAIDPRWSPDSRRIVFEQFPTGLKHTGPGTSELYVMRVDAGSQLRLTRNRVYDGTPAWSPDGRRIAFVRFGFGCAECSPTRPGGAEIFVMNRDGTGVRRLTHNRVGEASPAWQPVAARRA
jgi:TolB protein